MKQQVASWKGMRPLSGWRSVFATRISLFSIDWHLVLLAAFMLGTSLVLVHTMEDADLRLGRDGVSFAGHVKKLAVALPFALLGFFLRPRWLRKSAWLVYWLSILLLALVPVLGEARNNARRWIQLPLGFDLQPSELAKLGLIVVLARVLYRNRLTHLEDWLKPAGLALLPMALVMAQPDLGTALLVAPILLGMAWLAGARAEHVATIVLGAATLGFVAYELEWVHGYQLKRVEVWAAGFDNEQLIEGKNGAGFHAYQARVAIGNGGLFGTGLGRGVANEAGHLPERDCDSIFAVLAEEGGFAGALLFVLAYVSLGAGLLAAAARVRERFARLVVGGIALYFLSHFFINTGVNVGLLPMTGLTLPLVSTGGSSLLASLLALGLALGLSARHEATLDSDAFRA